MALSKQHIHRTPPSFILCSGEAELLDFRLYRQGRLNGLRPLALTDLAARAATHEGPSAGSTSGNLLKNASQKLTRVSSHHQVHRDEGGKRGRRDVHRSSTGWLARALRYMSPPSGWCMW